MEIYGKLIKDKNKWNTHISLQECDKKTNARITLINIKDLKTL